MGMIYVIKSIKPSKVIGNTIVTEEFDSYNVAIAHLTHLINKGIEVVTFNTFQWDDEGEEWVKCY